MGILNEIWSQKTIKSTFSDAMYNIGINVSCAQPIARNRPGDLWYTTVEHFHENLSHSNHRRNKILPVSVLLTLSIPC